jgi:hypothetical protein
MKTFTRLFAFFLLSWLACGLQASEVNIQARADKQKAELGETVQFQVVISISGPTQFTPKLEVPPFEGFQARGQPRQEQGMNWVNGQVTQSVSLTWELSPVKSGRLKLGPARITLKDPSGEKTKEAPAVYVTVAKPSTIFLKPTPTLEAGEVSRDTENDELRPIKPDLGFPWQRAGLIALAVLAVLGLAAWLALRPPKPKPVEVVRNPGQKALYELEQARLLLKSGEEEAYFKEVSRILRDYFKVRLSLPMPEPTLLEIQKAGRVFLVQAEGKAGAEAEYLEETFNLLVLVLFAKYEPQAKESDQLAEGARKLVLEFEDIHKKTDRESAKRRVP